MKILELKTSIKKDLEKEFSVPICVNILYDSESNFYFRISENESNIRGLGFDIYLKFRKLEFRMHWLNMLMSKGLASTWKENLKNSFSIFSIFQKILENEGCGIEFYINNNLVTIIDALKIDEWNNFEIVLKKKNIEIFDLTDFHYNNFSKLITTFWGLILSISGVPSDYYLTMLKKDGTLKHVNARIFERNPINRQACILLKGCNCSVCGINFESVYGEIGKDFIEIHHITPVSSFGEGQYINPETDLVPLCPNCHAMIHKKTPPFTISELKEKINGNK